MTWSQNVRATYRYTFSVHCVPICVQYQWSQNFWSPHLHRLCSDGFSSDNTMAPPSTSEHVAGDAASFTCSVVAGNSSLVVFMALHCLSLQFRTGHMDWEVFALALLGVLWCFLFLVTFLNSSSTPLQHSPNRNCQVDLQDPETFIIP